MGGRFLRRDSSSTSIRVTKGFQKGRKKFRLFFNSGGGTVTVRLFRGPDVKKEDIVVKGGGNSEK